MSRSGFFVLDSGCPGSLTLRDYSKVVAGYKQSFSNNPKTSPGCLEVLCRFREPCGPACVCVRLVRCWFYAVPVSCLLKAQVDEFLAVSLIPLVRCWQARKLSRSTTRLASVMMLS